MSKALIRKMVEEMIRTSIGGGQYLPDEKVIQSRIEIRKWLDEPTEIWKDMIKKLQHHDRVNFKTDLPGFSPFGEEINKDDTRMSAGINGEWDSILLNRHDSRNVIEGKVRTLILKLMAKQGWMDKQTLAELEQMIRAIQP